MKENHTIQAIEFLEKTAPLTTNPNSLLIIKELRTSLLKRYYLEEDKTPKEIAALLDSIADELVHDEYDGLKCSYSLRKRDYKKLFIRARFKFKELTKKPYTVSSFIDWYRAELKALDDAARSYIIYKASGDDFYDIPEPYELENELRAAIRFDPTNY